MRWYKLKALNKNNIHIVIKNARKGIFCAYMLTTAQITKKKLHNYLTNNC